MFSKGFFVPCLCSGSLLIGSDGQLETAYCDWTRSVAQDSLLGSPIGSIESTYAEAYNPDNVGIQRHLELYLLFSCCNHEPSYLYRD